MPSATLASCPKDATVDKGMESPIHPWFIALIGFHLVMVFFWIRSIDSIVRRLHDADHAQWIELGSPGGVFWTPPTIESTTSSVPFATQHLIGEIFLVKPDWVKKDPRLITAWNRMFLFSLVLWINPVVALIATLQSR